jgi:hypothetical protein
VSTVPVTDTLSYAFNTGAVIIGVAPGVGSGGRLQERLQEWGLGAGSVKGVGAGVDSTVTGSAGIGSSTLQSS